MLLGEVGWRFAKLVTTAPPAGPVCVIREIGLLGFNASVRAGKPNRFVTRGWTKRSRRGKVYKRDIHVAGNPGGSGDDNPN